MERKILFSEFKFNRGVCISVWDKNTKALLSIVHMLPSTAKGKKIKDYSGDTLNSLIEKLLIFSSVSNHIIGLKIVLKITCLVLYPLNTFYIVKTVFSACTRTLFYYKKSMRVLFSALFRLFSAQYDFLVKYPIYLRRLEYCMFL